MGLGFPSRQIPGASVSVQESWSLEHVAATGVGSKSVWFPPLLFGLCGGKVLPFGGCKVVHVYTPAGQSFGKGKSWRHPGTLAPSDIKANVCVCDRGELIHIQYVIPKKIEIVHCLCKEFVLGECYRLPQSLLQIRSFQTSSISLAPLSSRTFHSYFKPLL